MKFKLLEKYILSEKFILTEAGEDTTENTTTEANDTTSQLSTKAEDLVKTITDIDSDLDIAIEFLEDLDENQLTEINKTLAKIYSFPQDQKIVDKQEAVFKEIDAYLEQFVQVLGLNSLITNTKNKKLTSAIQELQQFQNTRNEASRNLQDTNLDTNAKANKIRNLVKDFETLQNNQNIKVLQDFIKNKNRRENLKNSLKQFKNSMKQLIEALSTLASDTITASIEKRTAWKYSGNYWKQFKSEVNQCIESFITLNDQFNELKATPIKQRLLAEPTKLEQNLSQTIEDAESTIKQVNQLLEQLKSWNKEKVQSNTNNAKPAKTDWALEFKNATKYGGTTAAETSKALNSIWDKYFKEEWAGYDVSGLKANLANFSVELEDLGYTARENPFIPFLRKMLKKSGFTEAITTNTTSYAVLHNAYADGIISTADMLGNGELGIANIIFRPNFYKLNVNTTQQYLKQQYEIQHIFGASPTPFKTQVAHEQGEEETKQTTSDQNWLNSKYANNIAGFVADAFYEGHSPFRDVRTARLNEATLDNKAFKSSAEINKILDQCFNAAQIKNAQRDWQRNVINSQTGITITRQNLAQAIKVVEANISRNRNSTPESICKQLIYIIIDYSKVLSDYEQTNLYSKYDIRQSIYARLTTNEKRKFINSYFKGYNLEDLYGDKNLTNTCIEEINKLINKPNEKKEK